MKIIVLSLLNLVLINSFIFGQIARSPYPIIFVHGINDGDGRWDITMGVLGGQQKIFDVCLNHDGNNYTSSLDTDVASIGWRYNNPNTPSPTGLYAINFDNTRFNQSGHSSHTLSNQAAIYKQGRALQMMIREVLRIDTGANKANNKVILVGHSMGGLAIREYLQRKENGIHVWWADPNDNINGHKVAKVITIGTPHGGSDVTNVPPAIVELLNIDSQSEAIRDLRKTEFGINVKGVYLFGGLETESYYNPLLPPYNYDINCNNNTSDSTVGISESYESLLKLDCLIPSAALPLPLNIWYTWIVSIFDATGDGVVNGNRQWLFDFDKHPVPLLCSDTLMTDKPHIGVFGTIGETEDFNVICRALDEPDSKDFAYNIKEGEKIKGYINYKNYYINFQDADYFKIVPSDTGFITLKLNANNSSGIDGIELDSADVYISHLSTSDSAKFSYHVLPGNYYIKVTGTANNASINNPYTLSTSFSKLHLLNPNGGEILLVDSTLNIYWTSSNIDYVKLELSTNGGINWTNIIGGIPASPGHFSIGWGVPNTPSDKCLIRISDASDPDIFDLSDNYFHISLPLTIISPNNSENWNIGSTQQIKWNAIGIGNIKIEYSTNNGTNWSTVLTSTPASACSYSWTVPNTPSINCKIKISDIANISIYDISDSTFTISPENFWSSDPNINNPICSTGSTQTIKLCSNGSGGAIITWVDRRSDGSWNNIYAQKINANGVIQWQSNGVLIRNSSPTGLNAAAQNCLAITSDGNNGAIITWSERRNDEGGFYLWNNIYAQRINSNGSLVWTSTGVEICTSIGDQLVGSMISDGSGGAIIAWKDNRNGNYDIYAQKINSNGIVQWTLDGIAICSSNNDQDQINIISDGNGGAIITWVDNRNNNKDIYSQRINSNGLIQWASNGVPVCTVPNNIYGTNIATVYDDNGGVICTWKDNRNGNIAVYAQRLNASGNALWTINGILIGTHYEGLNYPTIASDGNGGAIIDWVDIRNWYNICVQRISSSGIILWTSNGVSINSDPLSLQQPFIVSDLNEGAIITWAYNSDSPMHPNFNIRGQRINSNGNTLWGGGGTEICNNPGQQNTPNIISDGNGGIIATWEDGRNGGSDIYASKINANGILGGESYPLPVELSTFTASVSDSKVSLSWKTETEVNNYGFEVERKSGISNWNKIGFVTGKGNNNNNQSYSFIDENRNSGKYSYRLKQIDKNGKYAYSKIIEISIATPIKYELSQNYPNPFNPTTVIRYAVPFESNVNIRFYNSLGQCVRELNETSRKAGYYEVNFNASGLASGVYFYSIKAASTDGKNNFNSVKKMLMLK